MTTVNGLGAVLSSNDFTDKSSDKKLSFLAIWEIHIMLSGDNVITVPHDILGDSQAFLLAVYILHILHEPKHPCPDPKMVLTSSSINVDVTFPHPSPGSPPMPVNIKSK